jgi:hypothetical protein
VGLNVQVREYTGELVGAVNRSADVGALCSFAAQNPSTYPLLSGVDPYDDTTFNPRQAAVVSTELASLAAPAQHEQVRQAATELLSLTALLEVQPGRPHHRRLMFIGD